MGAVSWGDPQLTPPGVACADVTSVPVPLCESCALLRPGPEGFGHVCAASPDGIPDAIYIDGFDHRQTFPGDGGVLYEPEPGGESRLAAYEASRSTV